MEEVSINPPKRKSLPALVKSKIRRKNVPAFSKIHLTQAIFNTPTAKNN